MRKTLLHFICASLITLSVIKTQAQTCVIPVIIHIIHGGQAVGTYPNLAQAQVNSQIQVLNDDFAGTGFNSTLYPVNAFTTFATNTIIAAASKDGSGRIKIANTNITFCLALKDSLGNTLAEPGIHRVDYNTLPTYLGNKNPASYSTSGNFMTFMDNYIKPNTTWNCSKYYNIWVTDASAGVSALLGYAAFPPASTLPGISVVATKNTDGIWVWGKVFGSSNIFPSGTYQTPWDLGRVATHNTGHYFGLTHSAGSCPGSNDWCDDTPGSSSNVANCATTYPFSVGTCTAYPSNSPDGEMFMNFMGYADDCAMYMFTQDQTNRMNVARMNSPYRKLLGTHGLCPTSCALGVHETADQNNFTIYPNPANDHFVIDLNTKQNLKIEVRDAIGKIVIEKNSSNSEAVTINVSSLSKGIYFVNVTGENFKGVKKLVIE